MGALVSQETRFMYVLARFDIAVDLGLMNVHARLHYSLGWKFGSVDVRATLGSDVPLDFRWVYVYHA